MMASKWMTPDNVEKFVVNGRTYIRLSNTDPKTGKVSYAVAHLYSVGVANSKEYIEPISRSVAKYETSN